MAIINIQFNIPDEAILDMLSKAKPAQPLSKKSKLYKSLTRKSVERAQDPAAPWGRKKDGTPKKRPGRAPKVAA